MAFTRLWPSNFRGRLFVIFVAVMALPLSLTVLALITTQTSSLEEETLAQLRFSRDAKQAEIEQYLAFSVSQAETLTKTSTVRYSIGDFYGFSYGFRMIDQRPEAARQVLQDIFASSADGAPAGQMGGPLLREALDYANAHNRFHEDYLAFLRTSEFDNLYLVSLDGRIVYSAVKDGYLGSDLGSAFIDHTPLARLTRTLVDGAGVNGIALEDFSLDPVSDSFSAYVGILVELHGRPRGVALFRLPAQAVDAVVQGQFGNRAAGQLYLTSADGTLVSGPPDGAWATGEQGRSPRSPASQTGASHVPGLGGEPALAAWAAVPFGNSAWHLTAEVPTRQAFAKIESLTRFVLLLAGLSLPVIFWTALLLSRSISSSLGTLADAAESIAAGKLEMQVPAIAGPVELSRLTQSFERMRNSVLEQLALIRQKNAELEQQVAIIAEKNTELEEADRQKDAFVANTSHELRTPLNGIIGISGTLAAGAAGELSPVQRGQMEIITYSARRLSRLVDDLLDLYRIRQGRMRLDIHAVHLPTSIRNVLSVAQTMVWGESIAIKVQLDDDLPYLLADPVRLEQILYNLVGNAIKYAGNGTIWISARKHGSEIEIAVRDTGAGISPDNLERVFQPLERASGDEVEGSGLGLTIARQLAHAMTGRLSASSELGSGSVFRLVLPVAEIGAELASMELLSDAVTHAITLAEPVATAAATTSHGTRLLLVDDEPVNLQVLRNVLLPLGYDLETARNGHEAIDAVCRSKPDLVILDVMMPGMSGLDVARKLRERHTLYDLPIIMLTARSRTRDLLAGFESGANDYVCKPFVKDELLARIASLLAASKAQAQARENAELREEIERRVRVEDALRLSQQRMSRLLDTVSAGVICATEAGRISYANHAAVHLLGARLLAGDTKLDDVLPADLLGSIRDDIASSGEANVTDIRLEGAATGPVLISGFELEPQAGGGLALIVDRDTASARSDAAHVSRSIRDVLDTVGPTIGRPAPAASAVEAVAFQPALYRETLVAVMVESLRLWRQETGDSKFDLAEKSGIWRVNLDRSSLQARTLDKYLLVETLPAQPRWRDVVNTAEFVLRSVKDSADADQLREALELLKRLIRKARSQPEETALTVSD
ncbi:hybrid sensor histidine kinase/response regulator [Devosia sediminis]|uniref:histidine kinase n=1 Tax=Devosia sediminis TaxID=2798801 RepID=A0A934MHN5_9HYPH|nr:response regulator [Devosia sediminis]MBJ3785297.1 response regulator [Devosia sediminis]